MSIRSEEQADHLTLQIRATLDTTGEKVMKMIRELPEYADLGLSDDQALGLLGAFVLAHVANDLGAVLAAPLFTPHNRMALLMGAVLTGSARNAAGATTTILDEARGLGWRGREVKHLETLCREFVNATARLAPVAEHLELELNRDAIAQGEQQGAAEA